MRVASYNVNSIRTRLPRLLAWLERERPDVLCLQELKVDDERFPRAELETAGYHVAVHGQRTYNGVAIASREPFDDVRVGLDDGTADPEARLIAARVRGVWLLSAYVPNGQTVGSPKWDYKLAWMRRLRAHLARRYDRSAPLVVGGDFNVAPEDRDVARPAEWSATVLCHPDARAAWRDIVTWGLVDVIRLHHAGDGPYTWWDYRMLGFAKNNGLRIDHILATPPLAARCAAAYVAREERKGAQPSDHAPVVAAFDD